MFVAARLATKVVNFQDYKQLRPALLFSVEGHSVFWFTTSGKDFVV